MLYLLSFLFAVELEPEIRSIEFYQPTNEFLISIEGPRYRTEVSVWLCDDISKIYDTFQSELYIRFQSYEQPQYVLIPANRMQCFVWVQSKTVFSNF